MRKILLTTIIIGFTIAEINAQAPASVGTAKSSVGGVQATDPAQPAAKQVAPAPAEKATPATAGTAKSTPGVQSTTPAQSSAKPGVQGASPAKVTPAATKTAKPEAAPEGKKVQPTDDAKQVAPEGEKKN